MTVDAQPDLPLLKTLESKTNRIELQEIEENQFYNDLWEHYNRDLRPHIEDIINNSYINTR